MVRYIHYLILFFSKCTNGGAGLNLMTRLLEKMIIPNMNKPLAMVTDDEYFENIAQFYWTLISQGEDYQKAAIGAGAIANLTSYLNKTAEINSRTIYQAIKALTILLADYSCLYGIISANTIQLVIQQVRDPIAENCQCAGVIAQLSYSNHIEIAEAAAVILLLIHLLVINPVKPSGSKIDLRLPVLQTLNAMRTPHNSLSVNNAFTKALTTWVDFSKITAVSTSLQPMLFHGTTVAFDVQSRH